MSKMMSLLESNFPEMNWVDDSNRQVFRGTYKNKVYEVPYETQMDTVKWGNIKALINQFKSSA